MGDRRRGIFGRPALVVSAVDDVLEAIDKLYRVLGWEGVCADAGAVIVGPMPVTVRSGAWWATATGVTPTAEALIDGELIHRAIVERILKAIAALRASVGSEYLPTSQDVIDQSGNGEESIDAPPAGDSRASSQAKGRLISVYTEGLVDQRLASAADVLLNKSLTTNERLSKIDSSVPIPPTASAAKLGQMLGVTKQAVMRTQWWREHRRNQGADLIGRRHSQHRARAKLHEHESMADEQ
jgi:hypothetical protein